MEFQKMAKTESKNVAVWKKCIDTICNVSIVIDMEDKCYFVIFTHCTNATQELKSYCRLLELGMNNFDKILNKLQCQLWRWVQCPW